jgi:hypothetical protein
MRLVNCDGRRRVCGVLAFILLIGTFWTSAVECRADELPADLDAVPRNAMGFVHVRAAELWRSEWAKDLRYLVDKAGPDTWKDFEKKCPFDPAILDRMTLIFLTPQTFNNPFPNVDPEAMSALVLVRTSKPFNHIPLILALGAREKVYRHHVYYFNEELWSGLAVIDERTFIVGSEESLVRFFELSRQKTRSGPLQTALATAAGKHQVVVGLNPPLLAKAEGSGFMPPPLQKLLASHCLTLSLELDDNIRFHTRLDYPDENGARDGEIALRQTLDLGRQGLSQAIGELERVLRDQGKGSVEDLPKNFTAVVGLGLLREIDTLLKDAPIEKKGSSVNLLLTHKKFANTTLTLMGATGLMAGVRSNSTFRTVGTKIGAGKGDPVEEHLKTLAKAFDQYREKHGTYPPSAIHDRDGRAVLSWQVALLPYLGEESLYKEFKLDEPWDSLHNKRLLKKMPMALRVNPGNSSGRVNYYYRGYMPWKTTTHILAGETTLFTGNQGVRPADVVRPIVLLAHINDREEYWTKPANIAYASDKPLPDFYGMYGTSIKVMLTDGTFRTIEKSMNEKEVRALIERGGALQKKLSPAVDLLQAIWNDFTQIDEAGTKKAWQGIIAMSKIPERGVPFVKERVKPAPVADAKRIAQCLADLDSSNYQKRVKAVADLEALGESAQPAIDRKLADKTVSLEARRRLEGLAQKVKTVLSAEELRSLRAIAVLEEIGTPAARAVLADLSRGGEGAVLTEQARRALARTANRSGK